MAQFRDSKDANLVVGAVLLIAVMVTVSVAVDAWTGKTAHPPQAYAPQAENLTVSKFTFANNNTINMVVENNGKISAGISELWINNEPQTFTANSTLIHSNDYAELSMLYTYINGTNYHFNITTEKGNTYLFTATPLP